jgi:hypothetical protein
MQPLGRLSKLPSELRLMIVSQKVLIQSSAGVDVLTDHLKQYEHMFPAESITIHAIRGRLHMDEDGHVDAGDHVAILATCRTIYEEAKPVLYTNIEFVICLRDQYWLHIWHPDNYVDVFGMGEDSEPDSNDWIAENPWLEDPRLLVPLNNVRKLSLAIEANANAEGEKRTWTEQLKNTLETLGTLRSCISPSIAHLSWGSTKKKPTRLYASLGRPSDAVRTRRGTCTHRLPLPDSHQQAIIIC